MSLRQNSPYWILTPIVGTLLALVAATTATAQSRVLGKIVDDDGKAVSDLTVRFTMQEDEERSKTATARKKGRFSVSGLPNGRYRVELVDSDLYVTRATFEIRRPDGLTVARGEIEGHPRDGVAGIPIAGSNEVSLTLVVAPRGAVAGKEGEMVLASPELARAAKLYNQGKYDQSIAEAEVVLAEEPESGEALYLRGVALEKLERYPEAEAALQQAAERIPDFPRIWGALGAVSLKIAAEHEANQQADTAQQAFARAAAALTQAVERNPETLSLQINLAVSLDRIGDTERLVPVLERILEQDPTHLQSRLRLATAYSIAGESERAMTLLNEIPATEKRAAITIFNVAIDLNNAGDIDGSLAAARRAAEIDPELPQPRRLIAQILLGKGDPPAAIEAIRAFLELAPDDAEADSYRRILEQLEGQ